MAAHTNRSPSPLSSRPISTNSRNTEFHSTRRSFNGNNPLKPSPLTNPRRFDPITPANSPSVADFSRRRSVGKESTDSSLKDCEEKENSEKDKIPRTTKLQSQAKDSKNFMAPTISAASKFTPSPREKPLVERNDLVRTSISLSDGKAMFFSNASEDLETKSEMSQKIPTSLDLNSVDSGKNEPFGEAIPVPKPLKKVTFSDVPQESLSVSEITDSDCSKIESFSMNKNVSSSPLSTPIAPLDADPSIHPYDPKTNFLSPRPQFLYYKPNPRIETLLNKEKGMGGADDFEQIEDNFMSENLSENSSLSDSEGTKVSERDLVIGLDFSEVDNDVRDSRDSEKEILEAIASSELVDLEFSEVDDDICVPEDLEKEKLEAVASVDMFEGLDFEDDDFLNKKSNFVQKDKKNPWGLSRFFCFSVVALMLLMAACLPLSITKSSSFEEFGVIKDLSFPDLDRLYHQSRAEAAAAYAKVISDRVARHVYHLSVYSIAFISKVADELGNGETRLANVKYMNLSGLEMEYWDGGDFLNRKEVSEKFVENAKDDDELYEEFDAEIGNFEKEVEAYEEVNDSIENLEDDVSETGEKIPSESSNLDSEYSENPQSQKQIIVPNVTNADQLASIISEGQECEVEAKIIAIPLEIKEIDKSNGDINSYSPDAANVASADQSSSNQESEVETNVEAKVEAISSEIMEIEKSNDHITNFGTDSALFDQDSPPDVNSLAESVQGSSTPKKEFLAHYNNTIWIASLIAILLGFAASFYHYSRTPGQANNISSIKQPEKAFSSQNWKTEADDDFMGVSACASEMSSFQKNVSSYNYSKKVMKGFSEVQSVERKTQNHRESLASSSSSEFTTGSPSFGSFTTFERIPVKNANGEDEIITPVRRSSRIRNHHQFISPL